MLEFHLHEVLCIVAIRRFIRASRSSSSPGPLVDSSVHGSHRVLGRWLLQPRRPSLAQAQPMLWSVHRDDIPGSATPSRTRLEDREARRLQTIVTWDTAGSQLASRCPRWPSDPPEGSRHPTGEPWSSGPIRTTRLRTSPRSGSSQWAEDRRRSWPPASATTSSR